MIEHRLGSERNLLAACVHHHGALDALVALPLEVWSPRYLPIAKTLKSAHEHGRLETTEDFFREIYNVVGAEAHDIWRSDICEDSGLGWETRSLPDLRNFLIKKKMVTSVSGIVTDPDSSPLEIAHSVMDSLALGSYSSIVSCANAIKPEANNEIIPTGFKDLDEAMGGGIEKGKCLVVGARPRVGKTAFATSMAGATWLRNSVKTLFISAEMSPADLTARIFSACTSVASRDFLRGTIAEKAQDVVDKFSSGPIQFFFKRGMTVEEACGAIRLFANKWQGQKFLVVVDYLQRLQVNDHKLDDVRKIQKIALALSDEASRSNVALVALAQLNRASEHKKDKEDAEEKLSDLKGSGAIEEMADAILFIKRDWDFRPSYEGESQSCQFKIMKNRAGGYPEINLYYTPHYTRFGKA
jgi:KaiC/GvpD/RAD55 family RecA-like ATPase